MADHVRKINDTLPPLDCTLSDANGAFDLSNYTVRFVMRNKDDTLIVDATTDDDVTVLNSTAGRVRLNWASTHVDTAGDYLAEWEATNPSTQRITFPNNGHLEIVLKPEQAR